MAPGPTAEGVSTEGVGGSNGFISVGFVSFVLRTETAEPDINSETTESGRNLIDLFGGLDVADVGMGATV
jgi:hypothetical protein